MTDCDVGRLSRLLDTAVGQATFVVETIKAGDKELAPRRHLRWPTTVENSIELNAKTLRQFYNNPKYRRGNHEVRVTIRISTSKSHDSFQDLISDTSILNVVHDQKIGHVLPDIIKGPSYYRISQHGPNISTASSDVSDIGEYLIIQAALTGPNVAASSFLEWSEGKDLTYETRALISGIQISRLIRLGEGLRFERLPDHVSDLSHRLPRQASIAESDYLGRVLLVVKCSVEPAFWNPDCRPKLISNWGLGDNSVQEFCDALSVVCDAEIHNMVSWEDYGPLAAFHTGAMMTTTDVRDTRMPRDRDVQVRKKELSHAFDLLCRSKDKEDVRVGMRHWVKSKRRMLNNVDRLTYLRTALEATLLNGASKSEVGFRLALHGAWILGGKKDARRMNYRNLKRIYNLSSSAVHSGKIKNTKENRELLKFGQDVCRRAIIKRARAPEEIDWEEIILGR